tara:strand:+ start:2181 stop:3182 length:1002 start_codon:yes stop_codon:yes gene_type:complete
MLSFKHYLTELTRPFNALKIGDLRKDENRPANFVKKVSAGLPFQTTTATDVIINKSELEKVKAFMTADDGKFPISKSSMTVKTSAGELKVPNSFLKTPSFGGKGQGSGTSKEDAAMKDFNEKLNAILIKENLGQVSMKINGRKVDVALMVKTVGKYQGKEPKSDMTLVDAKGEPQAYISHKAGRSAKDYQQYGGLSYKQYASNKDIQKFMKAVLAEVPQGLASGQSFYRKIKDKQLVLESVFGPEYGGEASIHNVDEFHLGNMSLKGSGAGPYEITSTHKGNNGDIPKGEFEAYYFIRYQARRGAARAGGVTVPNARVGIFPKAKIVGTSKEI